MCLSNLVVDKDKCVHCGKCIQDCITSSLEFDENNIPKFTKNGETRCLKCQHCLAICPTGALSIFGKSPQDSDEICNINPDNVLNLIKSRRSIRWYKSQNLDTERMNKLKDMLKWTPTGCNFHKLHFSFVDDIEVMDDFRNKVNSRLVKFLNTKPINLLVKKFEHYKDALEQGEDIIFREAPHMVIVSTPINTPCVHEDPIIALSYFELYAQSLGVGTLWCGFANICFKIFPDLYQYIKVPNGYKVSYIMLFGEPDVKYARTTQPDDFEIISVPKSGNNKVSWFETFKCFFLNLLR